jgi:hypothetical protein
MIQRSETGNFDNILNIFRKYFWSLALLILLGLAQTKIKRSNFALNHTKFMISPVTKITN